MRTRTGRRRFLFTLARGASRLALGGAALGVWIAGIDRGPATRPSEELATGILRPPGALDEEGFLAACLRCSLCAQACDTNCIQLFGHGEGRHAGTPHIVAEDRACDLCLACTKVCPSGALVPVTDRTLVRMGVAVVDERLCVSHNGTGACGACFTVCPLRGRAITQGLRNAPTVHEDHCVGCGLCEEACIVRERRAIRVHTQRRYA